MLFPFVCIVKMFGFNMFEWVNSTSLAEAKQLSQSLARTIRVWTHNRYGALVICVLDHISDNIFWNVLVLLCVNFYEKARCQKWLLLKRSSRPWSFRHAIAWVWGGTLLRWLSKCDYYVIVMIWCLLSLELMTKNIVLNVLGEHIHLVWWLLSDSVIRLSLKAPVFSC